MNPPLVSCVMPTWNRRPFIQAAIDCWQKQTYENRELVILDDGDDKIGDLVPEDPRIRYVPDDHRLCTGEKRNRICELAAGEIICHFDDDDWSAPTRIERQVALLEKSKMPVTGYSVLVFWHVQRQEALIYRATVRGYVCGTTLCYRKDFWEQHRFRARQEASDNDFVYPILRQIAASSDSDQMVGRIHDCHHTSRKAGITKSIARELIPPGFWPNERLRFQQEQK